MGLIGISCEDVTLNAGALGKQFVMTQVPGVSSIIQGEWKTSRVHLYLGYNFFLPSPFPHRLQLFSKLI